VARGRPRSRLGAELDRRPATPLVGRDQELGLLRRLYQQTRRAGAAQLVTIVGEPGIGKTRPVRELLRFVDDQPELVVWRQGRCLSYGDGITFWALGEIVKAQAGVLESDDVAVVAAKLKAAVAAVVADENEREWLRLRLAPLLGLTRPRDADRSTVVPLAALRPDDMARLIGGLLGSSQLPAQIARRCWSTPTATPCTPRRTFGCSPTKGCLPNPTGHRVPAAPACPSPRPCRH
jgi:AAA ATPase domain